MEISLNKIFVAICLGAVFILFNNLRLVQYDVEQFKKFHQLKKLSYVLNLRTVLPKKQFNISKWYKNMLEKAKEPKKQSLKIYIYELPRKFNKDIISSFYPKLSHSASNDGIGPELYREKQLSMHSTPEHSLEWLMHEKLLSSSYRTLVPTEADLFYIPAYLSLACLCKDKVNETALTKELFAILKTVYPFRKGKPHLSTVIEFEPRGTLTECSLFKHPMAHKVTYISTRNKQLLGWNYKYEQKLIMAPYFSSAHLIPEYSVNENTLLETNSLQQRVVQVFMVDSEPSNSLLQSKIKSQFKMSTNESFEKFNNSHKLEKLLAIMLTRPGISQDLIIKWMQHSIFCLQPAGYSSPRKSFYDAVMSGCIPVIVKENRTIDFPFQTRLNYSSFTYTIPSHLINGNQNIIQILESVSETIRQSLYKNLVKVAHWLQYSLPDNINTHAVQYDALTLIMEELSKRFNENKIILAQ